MKTHEEKATCLLVAKLSFKFAFGKRRNTETRVFSELYYSNSPKDMPDMFRRPKN